MGSAPSVRCSRSSPHPAPPNPAPCRWPQYFAVTQAESRKVAEVLSFLPGGWVRVWTAALPACPARRETRGRVIASDYVAPARPLPSLAPCSRRGCGRAHGPGCGARRRRYRPAGPHPQYQQQRRVQLIGGAWAARQYQRRWRVQLSATWERRLGRRPRCRPPGQAGPAGPRGQPPQFWARRPVANRSVTESCVHTCSLCLFPHFPLFLPVPSPLLSTRDQTCCQTHSFEICLYRSLPFPHNTFHSSSLGSRDTNPLGMSPRSSQTGARTTWCKCSGGCSRSVMTPRRRSARRRRHLSRQ